MGGLLDGRWGWPPTTQRTALRRRGRSGRSTSAYARASSCCTSTSSHLGDSFATNDRRARVPVETHSTQRQSLEQASWCALGYCEGYCQRCGSAVRPDADACPASGGTRIGSRRIPARSGWPALTDDLGAPTRALPEAAPTAPRRRSDGGNSAGRWFPRRRYRAPASPGSGPALTHSPWLWGCLPPL